MDLETARLRLRSLAEPRYGVSLVAGRPFDTDTVREVEAIHSLLEALRPTMFALPNPSNVHATILRGKSSTQPPKTVPKPPQVLSEVIGRVSRRTLPWSHIRLDGDGAVRAYVNSPAPHFFLEAEGTAIAGALSETYGFLTRVQRPLWITIAHLCPANTDLRAIQEVQHLLAGTHLSDTTVVSLKLVYYKDLQLADAEILHEYELH